MSTTGYIFVCLWCFVFGSFLGHMSSGSEEAPALPLCFLFVLLIVTITRFFVLMP